MSLANRKDIIDSLATLEAALKENNMQESVKLVKNIAASLDASKVGVGLFTPYGLVPLKAALQELNKINGDIKITFWGGQTTISNFLDPIKNKINAEIKRFGGK